MTFDPFFDRRPMKPSAMDALRAHGDKTLWKRRYGQYTQDFIEWGFVTILLSDDKLHSTHAITPLGQFQLDEWDRLAPK